MAQQHLFVHRFFILMKLLLVLLPFTSVNADMAESREFMNGTVLRLAVFHYPPSINITKLPDGNFSYSGNNVKIMDYVAKGLNISYEYYHITMDDLKKYGPGPAQIVAIVDGKADIAIFGNVPSLSKFEITDFSVPILAEPWHFIVPWPKEESRLLAPIRPFQPPVWLCVGLSFLIMSPVLAALSGIYMRYVNQWNDHPIISFYSILYNASFMLSHLTNQGYHYNLRFKSRGSFILVGLWCLMCVVLANGYGGVLFSFLSVAKLEQPINTLVELANSKEVQLSLVLGSETARNFMAANKGPEKIIGESLKAHPDNLVRNLLEAKVKLRTGHNAFAFPDFVLYTILDDLYQENGKKCKLTFMKEPVPFYNTVVFNLAKDGPYTKAINEQMQAMTDAGILNRINTYSRKPIIDQCRMENQKVSSGQKPLSLVDMSSAFVVLVLGVSLSILVFLIELIFKRIKDHYFTHDGHQGHHTRVDRRQEKLLDSKVSNEIMVQSTVSNKITSEDAILQDLDEEFNITTNSSTVSNTIGVAVNNEGISQVSKTKLIQVKPHDSNKKQLKNGAKQKQKTSGPAVSMMTTVMIHTQSNN